MAVCSHSQGGFSLATQDAEEAANPNAIGKEELLSAVKYGLSKITANANSSISDEDIDTIIRKVRPRFILRLRSNRVFV